MTTNVALVKTGPEPGKVELRETPRPTLRPDEVLLEVRAVGVCGSDLHIWQGTQSWAMRYPVVLGHEFSGVVCEVGGEVKGWKEGDRAVSETAAVVDHDSPLTRQGLYNLDPGRLGFGASIDGAMRRYVPVPQRILHRMPKDLSFETAALTEPCCVAYNAVINNGRIRPGDRVLVIGPGPIGLLSALIAKLAGAVVAIAGLESDRSRLTIAESLGCITLIGNVDGWAREVDGLGVDGVVDAAGVSSTLKLAMDVVRPAGWISKVGWGPQPLNFSLDPIVQKNITLQGSFSHNWPIWERVIMLLGTAQLFVEPLCNKVWPLSKWHDAFEAMHSARIVKAILTPDEPSGGSPSGPQLRPR